MRCRFLRFGGSDSAISLVALSDKGANLACPLGTDTLSQPVICLAADNKIAFLSPADQKLATTATIPAASKSVVLVFVMGSTSADVPSWRVFAIDDSTKNFPDGGAYVSNFYNQDIRFIIGEHRGMLHPAGNHGYALPLERDAFNMATVVFEFLQDDQWRTASESCLRFVSGMRYLVFAYTDPESGRPRVRTFQDFAPPDLAGQ